MNALNFTYNNKSSTTENLFFFGGEAIEKRDTADFFYVMNNHLGNVLTTVSDRKIPVDNLGNGTGTTIAYFKADITNASDYGVWGDILPQRGKAFDNKYKYGFNGKEKIEEWDNKTGVYDFDARMLNVLLGRWMSCDPRFSNYSGWSSYNFGLDNPIYYIDKDGKIIYDKNGKEVIIEYKEGGIVIVNEKQIDPNTAEAIKQTYAYSSIGVATIKALDAKDVKHQVYVSEKHGVLKNKGKYGKIAGYTAFNEVNQKGESVFRDEKGNEYNSRMYLFNTEKEELNKDNIQVIDEYGVVGSEKQNIKAAEQLAKKKPELNRQTHQATSAGINELSTEDRKILDKIDAMAGLSKFFGWITTLVHESVHGQGDASEKNAYQKEIDSDKEKNKK